MKPILVGVDGSPSADRALEAAAELAKISASKLIITNVEQGRLHPELDGLVPTESASIDDILYAASREILARAETKARSLGVSQVRSHSGLGDIAGSILELAELEKPDVIVVGRRGTGHLTGLLLGSVSRKLVSLAPCKVLVVP
jgi:nucleotide-binding universal stress UspA family protein